MMDIEPVDTDQIVTNQHFIAKREAFTESIGSNKRGGQLCVNCG
jgi:hypothetical protein